MSKSSALKGVAGIIQGIGGRKFALALTGLAGIAAMYFMGQLPGPEAVEKARDIIVVYLGIEGAGDVMGRFSTRG